MSKLSNLPPGVTDSMIEEQAIGEPIRTHRADPICEHTWEAVRDSYEPPMPVGRGMTEAEAIADLLEQEEERASWV